MPSMADMYHTGMVVDDLESAMRSLHEAVGAEWSEPRRAAMPVRTSRGVIERESLVAFSRGEPPHIELIQQVFGGVWVPADGSPRLHHIGFWVDDLAGESARLEALGLRRCVTAPGDGPASSFAYHDGGQGGLFIELNDRSKREMLYRVINGQPAAGH
jgi:hypothetical protein